MDCVPASREELATEIASAEREELVQRLARLRMPQHLPPNEGGPPSPPAPYTQQKKQNKKTLGSSKGSCGRRVTAITRLDFNMAERRSISAKFILPFFVSVFSYLLLFFLVVPQQRQKEN